MIDRLLRGETESVATSAFSAAAKVRSVFVAVFD